MSEQQVLPELDITEEDKHRAYRYCGARFGSDISREALIDGIAGAYMDEIRAVHREKSETYCRERQLAQSEAERERLQGERKELQRILGHNPASARAFLATAQNVITELAREREANQGLRQVVKKYREEHEIHSGCDDEFGLCTICKQADDSIEDKSKPVATTS